MKVSLFRKFIPGQIHKVFVLFWEPLNRRCCEQVYGRNKRARECERELAHRRAHVGVWGVATSSENFQVLLRLGMIVWYDLRALVSSIHHSNSESLQTLSLCFFLWLHVPLPRLSSHYIPAFASHLVSGSCFPPEITSCPPRSPSLGSPDLRLFSLHLSILHHPAQTLRVRTKQSTLVVPSMGGICSSHFIPFILLFLKKGKFSSESQ